MTSKIIKWVIPSAETHQPGNIYLNLKAHKPPLYPRRLITTGCGALFENLSALTAFELKKSKLYYRIVDTPHVLRKLDELNSSNILEGRNITLVSIDIVDMFTNIPKDIEVQQCTKHLDDRPDQEKLFNTSCVIEALEITLDYNQWRNDRPCYPCYAGGRHLRGAAYYQTYSLLNEKSFDKVAKCTICRPT